MLFDAYREHVAYSLIAVLVAGAAVFGVRQMKARRRRQLRMRGVKQDGY